MPCHVHCNSTAPVHVPHFPAASSTVVQGGSCRPLRHAATETTPGKALAQHRVTPTESVVQGASCRSLRPSAQPRIAVQGCSCRSLRHVTVEAEPTPARAQPAVTFTDSVVQGGSCRSLRPSSQLSNGPCLQAGSNGSWDFCSSNPSCAVQGGFCRPLRQAAVEPIQSGAVAAPIIVSVVQGGSCRSLRPPCQPHAAMHVESKALQASAQRNEEHLSSADGQVLGELLQAAPPMVVQGGSCRSLRPFYVSNEASGQHTADITISASCRLAPFSRSEHSDHHAAPRLVVVQGFLSILAKTTR